jgi:hypothetical protein
VLKVVCICLGIESIRLTLKSRYQENDGVPFPVAYQGLQMFAGSNMESIDRPLSISKDLGPI